MMKYLVRETGKDGGCEHVNPDDAIEAAAEWEYATGKPCEIYMRWKEVDLFGQRIVYNERLSLPHTIEAAALAHGWKLMDMSALERRFDAIA